jgi:hypothetical protein
LEEPAAGVYWLVYRSRRALYTIKDAAHFREADAAGLRESLPANTVGPRR